jgi:hypothetical protein
MKAAAAGAAMAVSSATSTSSYMQNLKISANIPLEECTVHIIITGGPGSGPGIGKGALRGSLNRLGYAFLVQYRSLLKSFL